MYESSSAGDYLAESAAAKPPNSMPTIGEMPSRWRRPADLIDRNRNRWAFEYSRRSTTAGPDLIEVYTATLGPTIDTSLPSLHDQNGVENAYLAGPLHIATILAPFRRY